MAEELARKKKVRGGHKASATRMMSRADELMASEGAPDVSKLNQLGMSLKEKLQEIKVFDSEILALVKDDELEDEIAQADLFKERIYSTLIRIEKATAPAPTPTPTSTGPEPTAAAPTSTHSQKVRLPKLTIKPFSGKLTAWTPFWDSFNSAIHSNSDLSKVDKFNYLRSMVSSSALEAISGLTLTGDNYDEAVEILQKRFGNKQLIINKHMEQLLNVESITSPHDVKGLRQLYDVIESNVRSLKSLGVKADSYGSLLSSVLMNKLPAELRLIVSRKFGDSDSWQFDELLKLIEEEVQVRERSSARTSQSERRHKELPTAATLLTDTQSPQCCFCQQNHPSQNCQAVTGIDSRREVLRKTGRCYICLRKGHVSRTCRSRIKCLTCHGRHHVAICSVAARPKTEEPKASTESDHTSGLNVQAPAYQPKTSNLWTYTGKQVLLQTAQTTAFNPDCPTMSARVRIVMDTGSQMSYVTDAVRQQLALTSAGERSISIMTFGTNRANERSCECVRVGLTLRGDQFLIFKLFSVPMICEPLTSLPLSDCQKTYSHLTGLELADDPGDSRTLQVDILIGCDHYWDLITGRLQRGTAGPVAIETKLGWILSGPADISSRTDELHSLVVHTLQISAPTPETQTLDNTMRSFWELESFGIHSTDRSLYDELRDTIVFRNGRYEVQLPWKTPLQDLPNNYDLSLKRLNGLLRRLKQEPDILTEYNSVIKTQLQQGIVEPIENQSLVDIPEVHYLPHHAVVRRDKATTKLRVVYDASARSNGPSLNDCLNPGPKFDQKILDILSRFRVHRVAVTADIEKAFLMVSVAAKDREFLRFLWVDDPNKDDPRVIAYRFTRVVFGVTASPFLLNATLRHHLELHSETHGEVVSKVLRSIYVDDVVTGSHSEEEAYKLYSGAKMLLKTGAFNLRKFLTNSRSLQRKIDEEESPLRDNTTGASDSTETFTQVTLGGTQGLHDGEHKVLGVAWNVSSDQIVFSLTELAEQAKNLEPTKRNVISLIGRFYDPLGFLAPIVVRYKIFMQALCEAKITWDETIPESLMKQWNQLVTVLAEAQPISIPRCYLDGVQGEVVAYRLCGYCDASLSAYVAVVYLWIETENGIMRKFVVAKTRVAPLKKQSIPRLELLSAVLLARLMDTVRSSLTPELKISSYHCFTDSKVALCWIRNVEKAWKPFIQNRVSEIRSLLPIECWRHVPGLKNPADIPSRGATPLELLVNKLWRDGPEPPIESIGTEDSTDTEDLPPECLEELRASEKKAVHGLLVNETDNSDLENLVKVQDFSSLDRLIRVLTYVMRFCSNARRKTGSTTFSGSERKFAELFLIKNAQISVKGHKNYPMWKKQLMLFEDDSGILRCRGRIDNAASLPYSTKYPILLPSNHPLTTLYIHQAHARVLHNGVKETLTELRSRFWIVKGRAAVKRILHSCCTCRRYEGKHYTVPPPPPLPAFRVREAPPFANTGVDFAGPLYVSRPGEAQSKVWIVLYTCCVTRAIHLDLVSDMSAPTFIRSFKRFSSRRGLPVLMISDNGKAFEAAAKVIQDVVSSPEVQRYFEGVGIKWRFNVPKAPWWGGLFERLVRSTKRCLRKALGRAKLSHDELLTALIEIEMVLNSRPLTYISADDLDEPLTPSHLLVGRRLLSYPDHLTIHHGEDGGGDDNQLSTRFRCLNQLLDGFWKRWRKEYLLELREAHRHHKSSGEPQLTEGDIVVVHSDDQPRTFWKLGRVEKVLQGADGQQRAATVRVSKNGRTSTLDRPIQHLYPLEVIADNPIVAEREDNSEEGPSSEPERLRRSAAEQARDRILAHAVSEWDDEI